MLPTPNYKRVIDYIAFLTFDVELIRIELTVEFHTIYYPPMLEIPIRGRMGGVKNSKAVLTSTGIVNLKLIEGELKRLVSRIVNSTTMVLTPRDGNAVCVEVVGNSGSLDAIATGFYIDNYVVVTAMHPAQHVGDGRVCLLNLSGDVVEGKVMDIDSRWDLMFIESGSRGEPISLKDTVASVGDFVLACGTAYGVLRPFISIGIVSGSEVKADIGYGLIEGLLLLSLPILVGMSGSPVVDLEGSVIGMAIAKAFDANEFSLATPSTRILYSYRILKKYGRVAHVALGISVLAMKSVITRFGLQYGLVISRILNPDTSKICRLNSGDILLSVNGRKMNTIEDLRSALDEALIQDSSLVIEYLSRLDGKTYSCTVSDLAVFTSPRLF